MPIALTDPFDIGELDSGAAYSQFEIIGYQVDLDNKVLGITAVLKKWVTDHWEVGNAPPRSYTIEGSNFDAFMAANQSTYDAVKSALYSKIQELDARIVGTLS